jgi:hypothetical protein
LRSAFTGQQIGAQRLQCVAVTYLRANGQNLLDRALGDEQVMLVVLGRHHRHAAAVEVERDFIDLAETRLLLPARGAPRRVPSRLIPVWVNVSSRARRRK